MKFISNARAHLPLDRLDKVIFTPFGATDTVAPLPIQEKYSKKKPRKWRCISMMRIRIPQHVDADPDPPFHCDAGPEPITFHFVADPDQ